MQRSALGATMSRPRLKRVLDRRGILWASQRAAHEHDCSPWRCRRASGVCCRVRKSGAYVTNWKKSAPRFFPRRLLRLRQSFLPCLGHRARSSSIADCLIPAVTTRRRRASSFTITARSCFSTWGWASGYTEATGVMNFQWEGWSTTGPWGPTGTVNGNSLTVQYNAVMEWSDFEDAVYALMH